jgi:Protein of unknown function (DUF4199)
MNWAFVFAGGALIGTVNLIRFIIDYVFDFTALYLSVIELALSLAITLIFVKLYVNEEPMVRSWPGFVRFFLHIFFIFTFSTLINLAVPYAVYNHLDPDYKFERAAKAYQRMYEHRTNRGLPTDPEPNPAEIEAQFSLTGMLPERKIIMAFNFVFALLAYLPALFFHHLRTDLGPRHGAG